MSDIKCVDVMRIDSKLSRMLHVLLHMARNNQSYTSEQIAHMLSTNPVVVRRTMSGLREAGFVTSEKGHGGGWKLCEGFEQLTLFDIYHAVGEPNIFAIGNVQSHPNCLVEKVVNQVLDDAVIEAKNILLERFKNITLGNLSDLFNEKYKS